MKSLIILLFSLFSSIAEAKQFKDWTPVEKLEFSLYAAASYIDYRQTSWAMDHQTPHGTYVYHELNPVYGNRPSKERLVIGQFLSLAAYYYLISEHGDNKSATIMRRSLLAAKIGVTIHNDSIGISFSRSW